MDGTQTVLPNFGHVNAFLTLQCCLNCIIEENGGNNYIIPHLGKGKLENTSIDNKYDSILLGW